LLIHLFFIHFSLKRKHGLATITFFCWLVSASWFPVHVMVRSSGFKQGRARIHSGHSPELTEKENK